jgi:hypothetical protein
VCAGKAVAGTTILTFKAYLVIIFFVIVNLIKCAFIILLSNQGLLADLAYAANRFTPRGRHYLSFPTFVDSTALWTGNLLNSQ